MAAKKLSKHKLSVVQFHNNIIIKLTLLVNNVKRPQRMDWLTKAYYN